MSGIAGIFSPHNHEILPEIFKKIEHRSTSNPNIWTGIKASLGAAALTALQEKPCRIFGFVKLIAKKFIGNGENNTKLSKSHPRLSSVWMKMSV